MKIIFFILILASSLTSQCQNKVTIGGSGGGGASAFSDLTDKATANIPAINIPTATALGTKQPLNANLTTIGGLSPSNDNVLQFKSGAWTSRTIAQLRTDIGTIATTQGGTGLTTYTTGDILYASATNTLSKLSAGTSGYVLKSNGAGVAPSWQAGGGGSGTINSGSQYRLAYYSSAGTTLSNNSLITGSRALVSDVNGLPTHSSVTTTELNYVSGVTSALQTQLNAILDSANKRLAHIALNYNGTKILSLKYDGTPVDSLAISSFVGDKEVHVTGTTLMLGDETTLVIYDPASALATHTTTLPADPYDGQSITFLVGGTITSGIVITSYSVVANTGHSIIGGSPSELNIGDRFVLTFSTHNNKWYR